MKNYLYLLLAVMITSCTSNTSSENEEPAVSTSVINYKVATSYPHSVNAFTEGFLFHEGKLYESTGSPEELPQTESIVGVVDLQTGNIDEKVRLDKKTYFGEGIVFFKDKLYQLTYKNQTCFVYDAKTFKKVGQYQYSSKEGWGLTTDGTHVIMSDGTDVLTYLNPDNFQVVKKLPISENGYILQNLNELEFINGYIYANIWTTNDLVKIDPATGNVLAKMDLTPLKEDAIKLNRNAQETNGIAYNPETKKVLVTGKLWPKIYEIDFPL